VELAALDVPTLIVQGDDDVSNPLELTSRRTAALMPDARLVVYEGAPHGVFLSHAERAQCRSATVRERRLSASPKRTRVTG
jgi:pimeloyl-ACP methyl ester carboxylesterase